MTSSPAAAQGIFDLFALPRELRDEIYQFATVEANVTPCATGRSMTNIPFNVLVTHVPLPKLLQNCQCKGEYEQSLHKLQTLVIRDVGWTPMALHLKPRFCSFTKVIFQFLRSGNFEEAPIGQLSQIERNRQWMENALPQLHQLQSVTIKSLLSWNRKQALDWLDSLYGAEAMSQIERLTQTPKLKRIEIHSFDWDSTDTLSNRET